MTERTHPRMAKVIARLEGLSNTPVNASFSMSLDIQLMLEALTPSHPSRKKGIKGKTKETLERVVMEFVINTVNVDSMPLGKLAGIEHFLRI